MSADDIIMLLNELIRTSQDRRKGYAEAAELAQDPQLKTLFIVRSSECAQAIENLQLAVQKLGRLPEEEGTMAGAAHRGWIRLKTALKDNNTAVLDEVVRGEEHAASVYARVLQLRLPPEVQPLVERQHRVLQRGLEELSELRHRFQAAA
ncbi:MAG TPA: PA2169 family four-helix-bundle protein [Nevskia sp.]|jgi:uncharacterized protein (TIGR02284 family)|nr:PA2169 family four-helix-bundle protein [Nevskia sp.]